ncbi:hypothetical protein P4654_25415 [Niallia taxi]|uniref:hypothetical protein n=1 Tax=Niallia taxi TaxID=2499688 RepID=UPI002E21C5CA|nr:hypothetical protein [Niallia taxi]MED4118062.1 hypothetical protein [Niallia taxi]
METIEIPWYSVVDASEPISQGDILIGCPVFIPSPDYDFSDLGNLKSANFKLGIADIIIMTQACDLNLNNGGTPNVRNVVCAKIDDAKGESQSFLSSVRKNQTPAYHLLNKHIDTPVLSYQVVDFSELYTLPYSLLNAYREHQGKRLRLNSPYLELLSQRFGLFFSRIGIPDKYTIDSAELKADTKTT